MSYLWSTVNSGDYDPALRRASRNSRAEVHRMRAPRHRFSRARRLGRVVTRTTGPTGLARVLCPLLDGRRLRVGQSSQGAEIARSAARRTEGRWWTAGARRGTRPGGRRQRAPGGQEGVVGRAAASRIDPSYPWPCRGFLSRRATAGSPCFFGRPSVGKRTKAKSNRLGGLSSASCVAAKRRNRACKRRQAHAGGGQKVGRSSARQKRMS